MNTGGVRGSVNGSEIEEHVEELAEVAGMEPEEMAEKIQIAGSSWEHE